MKTENQIKQRLEDSLAFLKKQQRLIKAYSWLFDEGEICFEEYRSKSEIARRLISQTKDEIRTLEWILS